MGSRGEWDWIEWFRQQIPADGRISLGIGDDAAWLPATPTGSLVTVDMLVEGVHFDLRWHSPRLVGRKALNVNVSDIAAMAGIPQAAVVALAIPPTIADATLEELWLGIQEAATAANVALVGGDTNSSPAHLVLAITLLGQPGPAGVATRQAAKVGDRICVTGSLGYSLDGKHLDFSPRWREAMHLWHNYSCNSMMDLSDGLAGDLRHLTKASQVGAILDVDRIPIRSPQSSWSAAIEQFPHLAHLLQRTPVQHALCDGEDFELLFTLTPPEAERLLTDQPFQADGLWISEFGEITSTPGIWLRESTGALLPLQATGYTHHW